MENKVVYEVRLSKPVMTLAVMATVALLAIATKPLLEATPAFASEEKVQKVIICDSDFPEFCANIDGHIQKRGLMTYTQKPRLGN